MPLDPQQQLDEIKKKTLEIQQQADVLAQQPPVQSDQQPQGEVIPQGELPYQTYQRITGKQWTGGFSPEIKSLYNQYGITAPAGSAEANLALQKALIGGQKPVPPPTSTPTPPTPSTTPPPTPSDFPQNTNATQTFDDIFAQYGLSTKTNTIEDVVKSVSGLFGFDNVNKEIGNLDNKYAEDVMEINSNPWLNEGARSKKISLLKDKYETQKSAIIDRLKLNSDIVGKAITLFENEKEMRKDLLFKAIEQRQKEIDLQKPFELSEGQIRYEYDPKTGEYKEVAGSPKKGEKWSEPYSLGGDLVQKNLATGEIRTAVNVASGKGGEKEQTQKEISQIENRLLASKKGGEFIDGNVYIKERRRSSISSYDFDNRFSSLLSPKDRKKISTEKKPTLQGGLKFEDL